MPNSSRWQLVMASLLYPAFLGNLTYAAFETLTKQPARFLSAAGLLVIVLVVHYVLDFAYTAVKKETATYGLVKFIADLGIVVCLYLAIWAALHILGPTQIGLGWLATPALWMLFTKLLAVAWEVWEGGLKLNKWKRIKCLEVISDASFGLLYLIHYLFHKFAGTEAVELLVAVVFLDAAFYLVHEYYRKEWGVT